MADDEGVKSNAANSRKELLHELENRVDGLSAQTIARMAPKLVELLAKREPTTDWRILKLLSRSNLIEIQDTRTLVSALMQLMDAPEQATRSLAVDVIVKIGAAGAEQALAGLESTSPRVRAGSTEVLARLQRLPVAKAIELSRDTDPRVRNATLAVLGSSPEGVARMIQILSDPEIAVAFRAADQLGKLPEQADPQLVIDGLQKALVVKPVSEAAVWALARMGSDARVSIPAILAAYPVGEPGEPQAYSGDVADVAIFNMCPPRDEDLSKIADMLKRDDIALRKLVCRVLSTARTRASHVAESLRVVMQQDFTRYFAQRAEKERVSKEGGNSKADMRPYLGSATAALEAYWFVTEDVDEFVSLIEFWNADETLPFDRVFGHKSAIRKSI